ncbi:MAG TPA: HDOD domain-containing protein, partial [Fibrobacteria bacterium]|nr:HDOD domain-containing protein [Fibrobacteria bacterium]
MGTRAETEDARVAWWVDRACEKELPALSGTLGEIERALSKEEYSAFVLARVILQDPPLTSRVLRVANSAFYNPGGRPISMVSRAVMVLGFDSIRSICTSIAIVEALLRGAARDRLLDEIARALHAAVVSRFLARHAHDPAPEEVFVSTLLRRIGHMVLWSLGGSEVDALDEALKSGAADPEALEREILGFPLRKLSLALSAAWRLPTF